MDKKEYNERLARIEKEYEKAKEALAIECAKSNNPYQVGDILSNGGSTIIRVDKISYHYGYGGELPYCVYSGMALKKDLTPRKVKPLTGALHQSEKTIKLN